MVSETPLYQWHMYCNTEACTKSVWAEEGITPNIVCPTNAAHEMNLNSLYRDDDSKTGGITEVKIAQTDTSVRGKFTSGCHSFIAYGPSGTKTVYAYHYNANHSVSMGEFISEEDQEGDEISIVIAPRTSIGVLAAPAADGVTSITVSPTVFNYLFPGYFMELFYNGTTYSNELEISTVNATTNTVTFSPALSVSGATLSAGTTVVKMTYYMIRKRVLGPAAHLKVGATIIGGSSLLAGTPIEIWYTRNAKENIIAKLLAGVTLGDTTMTVSRSWEKYMCDGCRCYFKITDGVNTSTELRVDYFDDSGDDMIVHFTPAVNYSFALGSKIIKTATIPVVFAVECQI